MKQEIAEVKSLGEVGQSSDC